MSAKSAGVTMDSLYEDFDVGALRELSSMVDGVDGAVSDPGSKVMVDRAKQSRSLDIYKDDLVCVLSEDGSVPLDAPQSASDAVPSDGVFRDSAVQDSVTVNPISDDLASPSADHDAWISAEEFSNISGFSLQCVKSLINDGVIKARVDLSQTYVDVSTGTWALIKKVENSLGNFDKATLNPSFVEKTIATVLNLHDKIISSKDETISSIKSENSFLKDALISMQDVYDEDRRTIEFLRSELQKRDEEVEFMRRKYKLMWGKVSNSTK